jgi:hypothetical protein
MSRMDNLYQLPENLPLPVDDGATNHLLGLQLPSIPLMSTAGIVVDERKHFWQDYCVLLSTHWQT